MIPKILEFEDGRVRVTAAASAIPEIKAVLDKYPNAEAYLTYINAMSSPESPYINVPNEDKIEAVVYDIQATIGDFDFEDKLLNDAIHRLKSLYITPIIALANELGDELSRFRAYLKDTPLSEINMPIRQSILKDIEKYASNYSKIKEQADKELKVATKGDHELGGY